jgi:hypothetical protein
VTLAGGFLEHPKVSNNPCRGNGKRSKKTKTADKQGKKSKQPTKGQPPVSPIVVNVKPDSGLGDIEAAIDELARAVRFYVDNSARGENMMKDRTCFCCMNAKFPKFEHFPFT